MNVKFRCKVIRYLMSDSVSEMPIFGGFCVIFLWGRDLQTFGDALINYT